MEGNFDSLAGYVYRPLEGPKWIRAVQIHPSDVFDAPLQCDIIHLDRQRLAISLDTSQNYYFAVSYVWGAPDFSQYLICCEEDGEKGSIKITPNVDIMLRRLRAKDKSINFWIDAISLNQADPSEISTQIPLMGEIYSQSDCTYIWMGNEDDQVSRVFAFFRALHARFYDKAIEQSSLSALVLEVFGTSSMALLQKFLNRPWFSRRWIIQEFALSHDSQVCCHDQRLSAVWMVSAFKILWKCKDSSQLFSAHDETAQHTIGLIANLRTKEPRDLLTNLWEFHLTQCTDPRDKVLALIGISTNIDSHLFQIQGGPNMNFLDALIDTTTLYKRFAIYSILQGRLEHLMKHAIVFRKRNLQNGSLPSWCPDYSVSKCTPSFIRVIKWPQLTWTGTSDVDSHIGYKHQSSEQPGVRFPLDGQTITLKNAGVFISKIIDISPECTSWSEILMPILHEHGWQFTEYVFQNIAKNYRGFRNRQLMHPGTHTVTGRVSVIVLSTAVLHGITSPEIETKLQAAQLRYTDESFKMEFLEIVLHISKAHNFFWTSFNVTRQLDNTFSPAGAATTRSDSVAYTGLGSKDIKVGDIVFLRALGQYKKIDQDDEETYLPIFKVVDMKADERAACWTQICDSVACRLSELAKVNKSYPFKPVYKEIFGSHSVEMDESFLPADNSIIPKLLIV